MASFRLKEEPECSKCLNISPDTETLRCGHNLCRGCIGHVLNMQKGSGRYCCPQCGEKFKKQFALLKNRRLQNIVKNFMTSHDPGQEKISVFCTYCIQTRVTAVKSCLHCEAHLCSDHLRVHNKSPEHVLCDPTTSLENKKCFTHKKLLQFYCIDDGSCICVSCRLDGEHQGHLVETLDEASEKTKATLTNVLQKVKKKREEMEKRVQGLQDHGRKLRGKAAGEKERVTELFGDLNRRLEDLKKRVLSEISRQAEQILCWLSDLIQQLEIKKDGLSRKMRQLEELCNTTDPLTVLQESDTDDLRDTEDGDDEDTETHDKLLNDGGELDVARISDTLHSGLSDIMSGVNVQKCIGTSVYPHTYNVKIHTTAAPPRLLPPPFPTVQRLNRQAGGLNIGAIQQTEGVSGITDIFLDESTASNRLHISDDKKNVTWSYKSKNRPETPERFQYYPQVLSRWRFSAGQHYWEVDVGGADSWIVGMCYPSIDRTGDQSLTGDNKKSWGLERRNDQYSVIHNSNKILLSRNVSSNRVRIDLDYEAGQISFSDLFDPIQHLHTFTTSFTEPLHAVLGVWKGCIKISGGNQI